MKILKIILEKIVGQCSEGKILMTVDKQMNFEWIRIIINFEIKNLNEITGTELMKLNLKLSSVKMFLGMSILEVRDPL